MLLERLVTNRSIAVLALASIVGCSKGGCDASGRCGQPDDAATITRIDQARARLVVLSETLDACEYISKEIAGIDALLDAAPDSARALHLLGEALQLATEACPSEPPRSRHAPSAERAFVSAKRCAGAVPASVGCVPGRALTEGDGLAAQSRWADAAEAYRRELYGGCTAGLHWRGTLLKLRGAARLGLARAATHLSDDFEARRQLRLLDLERMGSTLHLGNEAEEARLWTSVGRLPPPELRPKTPEDAVRALERAAFLDDAGAFEAMLAQRAPERALLAGVRDVGARCDLHVGIAPTRLRTCIVDSLLPEAPRTMACAPKEQGRARCRVTGAGGDVREVELVMEVGAFRVLSSKRPGP